MTTEFKIISLIPSATEIVCALGFKENIVARSHECDFPDDIQQIPICTK
jgi:iron complex transport system substrate-binding protein